MTLLMSRELRARFGPGGSASSLSRELLRDRIGELSRWAEKDGWPAVFKNEKQLLHVGATDLFRLNLGGASRAADRQAGFRRICVARTKDGAVLLDVTDHDGALDVPSDRVLKRMRRLAEDPVELPEQLQPAGRRSGGLRRQKLRVGEIRPEWLYELDRSQRSIATRILKSLAGSKSSISLISGGPGTGKTSILIWLIGEVVRKGPSSLRVVMSPAVAEFVAPSLGLDGSKFQFERHVGSFGYEDYADYLFVDDPASFFDVKGYIDAAVEGRVGHVVIGLDFQQLDAPQHTDSEIKNVVDTSGASIFQMSTCYRQKSEIGRPVKDILDRIAESTPSNARNSSEQHYRDHNWQWSSSNDLEFTNAGGTFLLRQGDRNQAWAQLAADLRIEADAGRLWDWAPPILVLKERALRFPAGGLADFAGLLVDSFPLDEYLSFKGLEYQHVIMLLSQDTWSLLNRIQQGRQQKAYDEQRLSRIALTRARDSLTVITT